MSDLGRGSIRVSIDSSFHDLYKELSDGHDPEKSPFRTMKDIFMLCACLGYRSNTAKPVVNKRQIFHWAQFSEREDVPILKAMAIAKTGDIQVLNDPEEIVRIAEEYANAGFEELRAQIVEQGDQPLWELVNLIR